MKQIDRGSVAKPDVGLHMSSKTLVGLLHVYAEAIPDGVVGSRRLTPAKLMPDSSHSLRVVSLAAAGEPASSSPGVIARGLLAPLSVTP